MTSRRLVLGKREREPLPLQLVCSWDPSDLLLVDGFLQSGAGALPNQNLHLHQKGRVKRMSLLPNLCVLPKSKELYRA